MNRIRKILRFALPLVIIIAGIVMARHFILTKPKARTRPRPAAETLVSVVPLERSDHTVVVFASGVVKPVHQVDILPQVSGRITEIDPDLIPGGIIAKGKKMVQIETRDFELALEQKKAGLARAEHDLELEQGEQAIAAQEYKLLDRELSPREKDIVLRRPQLKLAEADLISAQSALEQAELDLNRTSVYVPFTALIKEKLIDLGGQASFSSPVARILGVDQYWVVLSLPVDQLKWLKIPLYNSDQGSKVKIYHTAAWGKDKFREGEICSLKGELQAQARMAQVLVKVNDPMCLSGENKDKPRLLVDMYVQTECLGLEMEQVISIPRSALHDGDTIWIMDQENKLQIRPVKTVWRNKQFAFIESGAEPGEKLVISDLAAPVPGIGLRIENNKEQEN